MRIWLVIGLLLAAASALGWGLVGRTGTVQARPSRESLVAWYDFDDTNDAHTSSYDLDIVGTNVVFTDGYAETDQATTSYMEQITGLSSNWNQSQDASLVFRWKPLDASDTKAFYGHGAKAHLARVYSGASRVQVRIGNVSATDLVNTWTSTEWKSSIATFEYATSKVKLWTDGICIATNTGPASFSTSDIYFGYAGSGVATDIQLDYAGFFNRVLRDDEIEYLSRNKGTNVTYDTLYGP